MAAIQSAAPTRVWNAQWIWQADDGPANSWLCFRKTFNLSSVPRSLIADIAADSKYWLWINGKPVVIEGGLKRGPTPVDGYYDELDIAPSLVAGNNTVAILVWYFGKDGYSHRNSGKGALIFDAGATLRSDGTWKVKAHPAYAAGLPGSDSNNRLSESPIQFDARNDSIAGWTASGFNDSSWATATQKGIPPIAPWNNLWKRPIPQWRSSGLLNYTNASSFPTSGNGSAIAAMLPYDAQVTPYLRVYDPVGGNTIDIHTDNFVFNDLSTNVRSSYTTKAGVQEFESLAWMAGHQVQYTVPSGVQILALQYRETGYSTAFAGAFSCNDTFYNTLWTKARRTLYVNMRDNYMDCPDRERAQWWGDVVNDIGQTFYAFDTTAYPLISKAISNLVEWQHSDGVLYAPVPSVMTNELPGQMLNSVGPYGFWTYYRYTGDPAPIVEAYSHVKAYLALWTLGSDGLMVHREGGWNWMDWPDDASVDKRILEQEWYYLALTSAVNMATLTGNSADLPAYNALKTSIQNNFNRVFWDGAEYRSPDFASDAYDRANALAVLAGLADPSKWPAIRAVLKTHLNAGPYMEKYVLEAQFVMGFEQDALDRMRTRYQDMVSSPLSTLWELWTWPEPSTYDTYNHAWSGGPLTLMGQYVAGVAPESPGFATYHVLPQEGALTSFSATVPSVKGNVTLSLAKSASQYALTLGSPAATSATIGISKKAFPGSSVGSITARGTLVWQNGVPQTGGVPGLGYAGQDDRYLKFTVVPGSWPFVAKPVPAKNACLANWRSTTCGQTCLSQTQSDRKVCQVYLDCYYNNGCGPSTCGGQDDVCGVNVILPPSGMAPKLIADQVYQCLGCP